MRLKAICISAAFVLAAVAVPAAVSITAFAASKTPAIDTSKIPPTPSEVSVLADGGVVEFQSDFGHSFYVYDKDPKNKSVCVDACIDVWAPVRAHDKSEPLGDWTLVDRGAGYMQWAYKGKPIYINVPQVVTGSDPEQNNDGHWHVLKP